MVISEIQKQCIDEGALMLRPRKLEWVKGEPKQYDVKPLFTGNKKGWVMLDHFTASAMQTVYDALKPENQSKWDNIPVWKLIDLTWDNVS